MEPNQKQRPNNLNKLKLQKTMKANTQTPYKQKEKDPPKNNSNSAQKPEKKTSNRK
jgi:hypothetical protein